MRRVPSPSPALQGPLGALALIAAAVLLLGGGFQAVGGRNALLPGGGVAQAGGAEPGSGLASRRPRGLTSVEDAVAARLVAGDVLAALDRDGIVTAFVAIDGADVRRSAEATAGAGEGRREQIRRGIAAGYAVVKGRALAPGAGLEVADPLDGIGLATVRFTSRAALLRVVNDGFVLGVTLPRQGVAQLSQSLSVIRQPATAQAGYKGAGTTVAVIDTGVDYTRVAFGSCASAGATGCRVLEALDYAPDDGTLDDNGHGTNVAGVVAGVAPGARLLAYDAFYACWDGDGWDSCYDDTYVTNALRRVQAVAVTYNVRAVNLSLGVYDDAWRFTSECRTDLNGYVNPYVQPFADLRAIGVLPVVAAGNNANLASGAFAPGVGYPACTPGAVSVGATYDGNVGSQPWRECTDAAPALDRVTCFSQSAPNLSMLAPGACITAAGIPADGSCYGGTSQAAPHVAGAAAVLAAARAGASVDAVQAALVGNGPSIADPRTGAGQKRRLDLYAAVSALTSANSDTTPPAFTAASPTQDVARAWTLGSAGATPVTATWRATDTSGITNYAVQLSVDGYWYDYTANLTAPTAESITFTDMVAGRRYRLAVAARDRAGNWTAWRLGPEFTVNFTQENGTGITYAGTGWKRLASSSSLGGYVTAGPTANAYARFTFSGRSVAWIGSRGPDRGVAWVYLDGTLIEKIDLYRSTYETRRVHFSRAVGTTTAHTLDVLVIGTSGRPWVDVDAFVVLK